MLKTNKTYRVLYTVVNKLILANIERLARTFTILLHYRLHTHLMEVKLV